MKNIIIIICTMLQLGMTQSLCSQHTQQEAVAHEKIFAIKGKKAMRTFHRTLEKEFNEMRYPHMIGYVIHTAKGKEDKIHISTPKALGEFVNPRRRRDWRVPKVTSSEDGESVIIEHVRGKNKGKRKRQQVARAKQRAEEGYTIIVY